MVDLIIARAYHSDCTMGRILLPQWSRTFFSLELPWLNNERSISCIEEGEYVARRRLSPSNGDVYELENVLNRDHIQIHAGNYTSDIEGCILVGDGIRLLNEDQIPDVTNSRWTLNQIFGLLPDEINIKVVGATKPLNTPML